MKPTLIKKLVIGCCCLVLAGCAAMSGQAKSDLDRDALLQQLQALPGAVVDPQSLTIAYPGDVLFAPGAALPLPGGLEVLEPLMVWMLNSDEIHAEARVRSSGHEADYDRSLAAKRRELLERLFVNRGLPAERITLIVDETPGAPLEIRIQSRSAATSSGEKS